MSDLAVNLTRSSPVPLYHQLARQLEEAIESGEIAKGDFLDNEIELAATWNVSRPTVRRAIQELVAAGLLVRRRGIGTQVVNDQVRRPVKLSSLYDDLAEQGRAPKTKVLVHERVPADADTAKALAIPKGSEVVHLVRLRSAGRTNLAIMRNWLLVDAAGDISTNQLKRTGLYQNLRTKGIRPRVAVQLIGATVAEPDDAEILGVDVGTPLVTMRRVMQDDDGRTVELGSHVYDARKYSVEMTVVA